MLELGLRTGRRDGRRARGPRGGGDRDGHRDGRGGGPHPRRRRGGVRADRPTASRRDAHAGAAAFAGPGRPRTGGPRSDRGRRRSGAVHRAAGGGGGGQRPGAVARPRGGVRHEPRRPGAGAVAAGHCGLVLACVDARRGEVFASVRELAPGGEAVGEPVAPALFAPDDLAAVLAQLGGAPVRAVGDGAQRYAEVLAAVPGVDVVAPALSFPPPSDVAPPRARPPRPGRIASRRLHRSFLCICARRTRRATSPRRGA